MTPISQNFIDRTAGTVFADAQAVDAFFATFQAGASFISWFNANMANKGAWAHHAIPGDAGCAANFRVFWDRAAQVFGGPPDVMQFICLMSIFINEVGGDLVPIEEKVNGQGGAHPGIAYAFDAIPGLKTSYNVMPGNRTALSLFADPNYVAAHGTLALAERFAPPAEIDPAWGQTSWPAGFPTLPDPAVTGFLLEADFFKFRGRGLIQTTGRANYLKLIAYIQGYDGNDPVLLRYQGKWAGIAPDMVATSSSNQDWHDLFLSGTLDLARQAIVLHNANSGHYLALASGDAGALNGTGNGSVFRMGLKISGSSAYAGTFQDRVGEICGTLDAMFPVG